VFRPGYAQHRTVPLRVLLVEDDGRFADFLRTALIEIGCFDVRLTLTGRLADALDVMRAHSVDAVLLDLNLPDSRGLATLSSVTSAAPHVPVVVLTGVDDAQLATEAVRRGAQDWLTKGHLEPELVYRAVRYAIERKRLEDWLLRSQKLEAVGRLAGTVAHEFNNLLTVVLANVQLLAPASRDRAARSALREIEHAAERGAALTQQLLGLARKQPEEPRVHAVTELVSQAVRALRAVLPESVTLDVFQDVRDGYVRIDQGQFEQVLLNLAINARDAMPDGGVLTVRTRREPPDESTVRPTATGASFSTFGTGAFIVVEIGDTGTGITADVLPRIFEPFYTTKKEHGTGLGLTMCEEIVARSGGSLQVRSTPGRGSTFLVQLPEVSPTIDTPSV
jgi:two-component system cell cycle sensor histidine kinase/response regulator CckA